MKRIPDSDLNHILDHTRDLWEEMRGQRIFLTGGTGFFGKWLLESLLWANDQLNLDCRPTVLTRSPDSFNASAPHLARHQAVTVLQGDVRDFEFPAGTFSHLIHAASESSQKLDASQSLRMLNTIVGGTQRSLEFAAQANTKKFLFTSSGAVYGKQSPEIDTLQETEVAGWSLPEDVSLADIYREGKRLAELECNIFSNATSMDTKVARCFAFVGPYFPLNEQFAIGNFIRDGIAGNTIRIQGDGTPLRSYLYAADLAIWLWVILFRGEACHPYNTGSSQAISIADLAKKVSRSFAPERKIEIARTHTPGVPVEKYIPSTQRAQTELGLESWIALDEAIQRTIHWYTS